MIFLGNRRFLTILPLQTISTFPMFPALKLHLNQRQPFPSYAALKRSSQRNWLNSSPVKRGSFPVVVIDSIPIHRDSFMKIILVAGARPNFMKIAPIIRAIKSFNQTNLSRLPCSESVRGLPCGVWKLLHGEPISLGPDKPEKPEKLDRL